MTHTPTTSGAPDHTPTTCFVCARRATGIGIAPFGRNGDQDPHYLCEHCIPLIAQIRATMKWDTYELRAIEAAVEGVGPLVGEFGVDISEWTAEQRNRFAADIVLGFGASIREQVRTGEVPF